MRTTKIFNDPVHGFIEIPSKFILQIIDHPYFQRLRNIKQLALTSKVYPGAVHTRFSHAIGAMSLMQNALKTLREKSVEITDEEYESTLIAILLHDIGHGPFSHALEKEIIQNLHHEALSIAIMKKLNAEFDGKLNLAIDIFSGNYKKQFLHQLVSSQLDMDRMDYLMRDSFFTGVVEGIVGTERIIKTMNVLNNKLVVEEKGIYSVEKFIISRRLMYWQVYLHKTVVVAELLLKNIFRRVRELHEKGNANQLFLDPNLKFFIEKQYENVSESEILEHFTALDDNAVYYSIKQWEKSEDFVLSNLCERLLNRNFQKIHIQDQVFSQENTNQRIHDLTEKWQLTEKEARYFINSGEISNFAYVKSMEEPIKVWKKNGNLYDIADSSDLSNLKALSKKVTKYYLCYPREIIRKK